MQDNINPQLELLLDHLREKHDYPVKPDETLDQSLTKLAPECVIVKRKVIVQVPKDRDLTREQVGDKVKELVMQAVDYKPNMRALEVLFDLCGWREEEGDGRVASRRIDANPKLSDLA